MTSWTVLNFSASSSAISMPNSSSMAMISSTRSRESAPRSSTKTASGVTSERSTPNLSTIMSITFSSVAPIEETSYFLLNHQHAAINMNHLASEVSRGLGGQEGHRLGHLLRSAETAQGNPGQHLFLNFGRQRFGHFRMNEAGGHGVHGNIAGGQLPGHRFGQADQPGLGGNIIGLARVAHHPHHRTDVDDASEALLDHGLAHRPYAIISPFEVHRQHGVPLLLLHPQDEVVPGNAGIVHQEIQAATLLKDLIHGLLHLPGIGHVEFDQFCLGPSAGHLLLGPGGLFPQGDIVKIKGQSGAGQEYRDGSADPPGGAGYQGH